MAIRTDGTLVAWGSNGSGEVSPLPTNQNIYSAVAACIGYSVALTANPAPTVTASSDTNTLWPPNHKMAPVTITGRVTCPGGINPSSGTYSTVDEYGTVQPAGTFTINANGTYRFSLSLEAWRDGTDTDGRVYTIVVRAKSGMGVPGSTSVKVTCPHDQGK